MDSFDVIISSKALSQLNDYIDYLQYTLLNDQAEIPFVNRSQISPFLTRKRMYTSPLAG